MLTTSFLFFLKKSSLDEKCVYAVSCSIKITSKSNVSKENVLVLEQIVKFLPLNLRLSLCLVLSPPLPTIPKIPKLRRVLWWPMVPKCGRRRFSSDHYHAQPSLNLPTTRHPGLGPSSNYSATSTHNALHSRSSRGAHVLVEKKSLSGHFIPYSGCFQ